MGSARPVFSSSLHPSDDVKKSTASYMGANQLDKIGSAYRF